MTARVLVRRAMGVLVIACLVSAIGPAGAVTAQEPGATTEVSRHRSGSGEVSTGEVGAERVPAADVAPGDWVDGTSERQRPASSWRTAVGRSDAAHRAPTTTG